MRIRISEMITRAEPAVQPVMVLYVALVAAASLASAVLAAIKAAS